MVQFSRAAIAAAMLLTFGCALPDDPARHQCHADEQCVSGHFCVAGLCTAERPDAAMDAPGADVPETAADATDTASPVRDAPAPPDAAVDEGAAKCDGACASDTLPPQIAAGSVETYLRTADRRIVCWGVFPPAPVRGLEVAVGDRGHCAIRENGTIGCFLSDKNPP